MGAVGSVEGRKTEPSRQPWRGAVVCALNARQEIVARTQKRPATEVTGLLAEVGVRSTSQQYLCQGSHMTATMSIAFANLSFRPLPSVG